MGAIPYSHDSGGDFLLGGAMAIFDELAENLKDNQLEYEQWFRSNPRRLLSSVLAGRSGEVLSEIEIALSERTIPLELETVI